MINDIYFWLGATVAPFVSLYIGFPWYASISKAWRDGNMNWVDIAIQGIPLLIFAAIDMYCNFLASVLYVEPPYLRGNFTLSQRSCYWWHNPQDEWRHGVARVVKALTDKYEKDHIS